MFATMPRTSSKPTTTPPKRKGYRSPTRTAPGAEDALRRLGARIRALREVAGLTQERAAGAANLTTRQVNVIENGGTNPTVTTLLALAKVFGVKVGELFEGV